MSEGKITADQLTAFSDALDLTINQLENGQGDSILNQSCAAALACLHDGLTRPGALRS